MIKLSQLTRTYRTENIETQALNNINLSVASGDFLAIMGPSGCGKSTLLSILGMLDSPSQGQYYFADTEIANYSEQQLSKLRKSNIGFIFQSFNLIEQLSVFDNVALPLLYQSGPLRQSKKQIKQQVDKILKQVGIDHRAEHLPQQLSGGQQQRVAIARALIINPKLILADEPTGNLDSKNGQEVMTMLRQLNDDGTTVIMVTHSSTDAQYANRIVHLLDGQISSDMAVEQQNTHASQTSEADYA